MKYEDILQEIGGFGRYQKRIVFLMLLSFVPNGWYSMLSVFILAIPEHRCHLEIDDINQTTSHNITSTLYNLIPLEENDAGLLVPSRCKRFFSNETDVDIVNKTIISCDQGWEYTTNNNDTTVIMEMDLVCENAWMKPLIISGYMFGCLIGGTIGGTLSDRYGRKLVFLVGTATQGLFVALLGISNNFITIACLYFVAGFAGPINYIGAFIINAEIVDRTKRAMIGNISTGAFTIGYLLLPAFAYFIVDWRWLCIVCGGLSILFLPYYWLIPESPRWLLANGEAKKNKEAKALIMIIAKTNGKQIKELDLEKVSRSLKDDDKTNDDVILKFTLLDLLKHPSVAVRTLILCFIWLTVAMTYYCISLGTSNLGGNKFINCFIAAGVEIPSFISIFFLMEKFGRRTTLAAYLFVTGIFCVSVPFCLKVDVNLMRTCAMVGKFCIAGVFSFIYIYTCELYPTKMRNMGLGVCYTVSRAGSMCAPFLVYAGENIGRDIPYIMIGCLTILSAVLSLLLPETINTKLPETLDDVIKQDRYKIKILCTKCKSGNNESSNDKEATDA